MPICRRENVKDISAGNDGGECSEMRWCPQVCAQ